MDLTTRIRLRLEREIHRLRFHGQLVPLDPLLRRAADPSAASPAVPTWRTISTGARLHNRLLAEALKQAELGTWALDAQVLNFLEQEIKTHRPASVLEFGAGLSTVCLAQYQSEVWGSAAAPRVFSVEQNAWQVEKSWRHLAELGLEKNVRILHAPLVPQTLEGRDTLCYSLPPAVLDAFLAGARPALVLIDGPAGDAETRFGTLPMIRNYAARQAAFYLDDALRPEELSVAKMWRDLPYLSLAGIRLSGKGVLVGKILP